MRPRLVFVHGIGGPRDPLAERNTWLRALAEGARAAGHSRRVLDLVQGWAADVQFAYYGQLFGRAQAQGAAPRGDDDGDAAVSDLLLEALDERLVGPAADGEGQALRHARAQLTMDGMAQGPGTVGRRVLSAANTLLSLPGLRTFGGWASAGLMVGQLRQVARYLGRGEEDSVGIPLDVRVRRCVAQALAPVGPTIVIAHSLGTVVSLEALHAHRGQVPLFVTLGSPLGLRAAVGARVRPQPLQVPGQVERWLNYWDRDDLIAGGPRLEKVVRPNDRAVVPVSRRVDSDGLWVHPAVKYLAQPAVAGPVVESIETLSRP